MADARSMPPKPSEFPILDRHGLYASKITGDGNCFFRAASDQLYGHQNHSLLLRQATIVHMRAHADFYRQYMVVKPVRRNPRRKTKSRALDVTPVDFAFHTADELQQQFDEHLDKMGQPGEWADNMEVSAFASALNVHVRLWQADYYYTFSPRVSATSSDSDDESDVDRRQVLNIAYHTWEHYSSVRNIVGPHTGLPQVSIEVDPSPSKKRTSVERDEDEDEDQATHVPRATKRRSPLPLCDSASTTPEPSESSSDESQPALSQPTELPEVTPKLRIILKLRAPRSPQSSPPPPSSGGPAPSTPSAQTSTSAAISPS